jgi:flagellar biosynthetic protein FlhB
LSGLKNLFSKQQLTTVVKMVFMTIVLGFVAWKYMSANIAEMPRFRPSHRPWRCPMVGSWLTTGITLLLVVVLLVALIDVPLQAFLFKSRLKMSHEEVKQEHKESEGSPQLKGKIRQKQREIADRASVSAVPRADFVVTNPTHYAVALRYDEPTMAAPQVIAKGTDLVALKIREIAGRTRFRCSSPHAGARAVCPCRSGPAFPLRSIPPWPRCWPMSIASRLH